MARWPGRSCGFPARGAPTSPRGWCRWMWPAARTAVGHPFQSRAMDKEDIRNLRRWHRNAALRAKAAEFDIVYVYATHGYLLAHFLDPETNTRSDEYGGSLENRTRLVRELIEETKEAVGDRCAVAVRFAADAEAGEDGQPILGERQEMFALMAEMPDLWDINIADYSLEMGASRFVKEGALEPYMTLGQGRSRPKPVVTVGRFTVARHDGALGEIGPDRPDRRRAALDRRSLHPEEDRGRPARGHPRMHRLQHLLFGRQPVGADPLHPEPHDGRGMAARAGIPNAIAPRGSDSLVLVVGAGPAGLEAARHSGRAGLPRRAGRGRAGAGRPGGARGRPARDARIHPRPRLARGADRQDAECRGLPRKPPDARRTSATSVPTMW